MKYIIWLLFFPIFIATNLYSQDYNTSYDYTAGYAGLKNSSFGCSAGDSITGTANLFNGYVAGKNSTTKDYNAFIGAYSGYLNKTGNLNTYLGADAARYAISSSHNTIAGYSAGYYSTASRNVILGAYAKRNKSAGEHNVMIGRSSGYNSAGSYNVFLGYQAGYSESDSSKLYIENTSSSSPLIYGEFDNDIVTINGNLGVGTSDVPDSISLLVDSLIIAKEIAIKPNSFPDYVFEEDYELASLSDLEKSIEALGHLPGLISSEEAINQGFDSGDLSMMLLQKVEELTLYLIALNNELDMEQDQQQILNSLLAKLQVKSSTINAEVNQAD